MSSRVLWSRSDPTCRAGAWSAAVAALGTKTRLRELAAIGFKPVALMVGETTFLALLVLVLLHYRFS
jgi:uncharacterized membrane protein YadS